MNITVSQVQGRLPVTILQPDDRINLGNADQLMSTADEAYRNGTRDLILDLTDVDSMTSAGLRAIIYIYKLLSDTTSTPEPRSSVTRSTHFKLVNPPKYVLMVLKTAGFDQYLDIYENLQDGIASF